MKFQFTKDQLAWLHSYVNEFVIIATNHSTRETEEHLRTAKKMRAKFAFNAGSVILGNKERKLIQLVTEYRLNLLKEDTVNPERLVVEGIWDKVLPSVERKIS